MALMYLPLNLDTMDWLMPAIFAVATVLQFWAGRGFYAAAWAAARHGATNMNTLVALGTGVAWGYSEVRGGGSIPPPLARPLIRTQTTTRSFPASMNSSGSAVKSSK